MNQIIQNYQTGQITLEDIPIPQCQDGGVLVKTASSLISIGTERSIIELGRKSLLGKARARPDLFKRAWEKGRTEGFFKTFKEAMDRLDTPIPLGYSAAGVILQVGKNVVDLNIGDRVACIGAGFASHAEVMSVPQNMCAKVPDSVELDEAAFGMLGCIALHGVRLCSAPLGSRIGVIGLGLLGLLSAQLLRAGGCTVFAYDTDQDKSNLAKKLGINQVAEGDLSTISQRAHNFSGGKGLDAVLIAVSAKDNKSIQLAADICCAGGTIILVGVAHIEIPRQIFWEKEIEFKVSKASGPGVLDPSYELDGIDYPYQFVRWTQQRNLKAFLEFIAAKKVDVKSLITHRFGISDALQAYNMLLSPGTQRPIGVLLNYDRSGEELLPIPHSSIVTGSSASGEKVRVGIIGAGLFGNSLLLPALKRLNNIYLSGIATTRGLTANHAKKRFGIDYCTTDYRELLDDKEIQALLILTRHRLHAKLVCEGLKAGKHIFVEKPLCVSQDELKDIIKVYNEINPKPVLMVGYNRRFSDLSKLLQGQCQKRNAPLMINCRVNAGSLPANHWVNDLEEGGRIIAEFCHYIDLCQYFADALPRSIYAFPVGGDGAISSRDNFVANIKYDDGSLASISCTSLGDRSYSRERVEIFFENSVGVLEDLRRLETVKNGKSKVFRRWNQDMGYENELKAFFDAVRFGGKLPISFEQMISTADTTFKVLDSLETGIVQSGVNFDISDNHVAF